MRHGAEIFNSPIRCGACAHEPVCGLFDRCEPASKRSSDEGSAEIRSATMLWTAPRISVPA